jgi:hypothetical protein
VISAKLELERSTEGEVTGDEGLFDPEGGGGGGGLLLLNQGGLINKKQ